MTKEKDNAPFKVRCHHCGQVIDSVMLDCFNHDGSDEDVKHEFNCVGYNSSGDPIVEVSTAAEQQRRRLVFVSEKSPEEALSSLPKEKMGMMIRLDDVGEPWLVKLVKDYSKAVAREADAKFIYEDAVKRRKEIEENIARIGGDLNQKADEKKRGEAK